MKINTLWEVVKVENAEFPYDTLYLKLLYPDNSQEKTQNNKRKFPVLIFFNGGNCNLEIYQKLVNKIVPNQIAVVLFDWLVKQKSGEVVFTPGIDIKNWMPNTFGTAPSSSALSSILNTLNKINISEKVNEILDLKKIILGGHSAGGRVSLENANQEFFPEVVASFSYGTAAIGFINLGFKPGSILPLPSSLPMLIMGGNKDGVVEYMAKQANGDLNADTTNSIIKTFEEGISVNNQDKYLVILEGANHYSLADSLKQTNKQNLDLPATDSQEKYQTLMADIISNFILAHVQKDKRASGELDRLLNIKNPLIAQVERK